jgi:WhiB family redox-sensing transcriptional regulator
MTTPSARTPRPSDSSRLRAQVRLFHTEQDLACREDPDLFFNPNRKSRAVARCAQCPFRGRCSYNAVASGATHGIWGGMSLPGQYPTQLALVYARLAEQFEACRSGEIGDVAVAPLPEPRVEQFVQDFSLGGIAGAA